VYARGLGERIARHQARVWLVNTGWTGGAFGVGTRMKIAHTRAMIAAALSGALDTVAYQRHPVFNVEIPRSCPDVPSEVLDPRTTWADKAAYDLQARKLAAMFVDNFKAFEGDVDPKVVAAGPTV
jgi:phosphoenolpyruvate carboxykinase (ATP)